VGVLEGYEFVEGHHDEPGVLVRLLLLLWGHELWLCKRNGMRAEEATGSREEGTEAGWAR
jgi:F420-0:gamma-glutamyl ligase-like protein